MAHYAILDENNVVINVIVGRDEDEIVDGISDWEAHYSEVTGHTVKRTSYNTQHGIHIKGGKPFRKNYAGIGGIYDPVRDAFYTPQPYPSWTLDEDKCIWLPPVEMPNDANSYYWEENTLSWVLIEK